jgi:hypothetical protein
VSRVFLLAGWYYIAADFDDPDPRVDTLFGGDAM